MSQDTITSLRSLADRVGDPAHYCVSGGEPTLRLDLLRQLLELFASSERRLLTNGWWGGTPHATRVCELLNETHVSRVQISSGDIHRRWIPIKDVLLSVNSLLESTNCIVELFIEANGSELDDISARVADTCTLLDESRVEVIARDWYKRQESGIYYREASQGSSYARPPDDAPFCEQLESVRLVVDYDGGCYRCCGTFVRRQDRRSLPYYLGELGDAFPMPYSVEDRFSPRFAELARLDAARMRVGLPVVAETTKKEHPCAVCARHVAKWG